MGHPDSTKQPVLECRPALNATKQEGGNKNESARDSTGSVFIEGKHLDSFCFLPNAREDRARHELHQVQHLQNED